LTVTVYCVVDDGVATGLAIPGLLRSEEGVQVKVYGPPLPKDAVANKGALLPGQIDVVPEALKASCTLGLTEMVAVPERQPFASSAITVYIIATAGLATGFGITTELRPADGDQE
jgi:hypothetical protein